MKFSKNVAKKYWVWFAVLLAYLKENDFKFLVRRFVKETWIRRERTNMMIDKYIEKWLLSRSGTKFTVRKDILAMNEGTLLSR